MRKSMIQKFTKFLCENGKSKFFCGKVLSIFCKGMTVEVALLFIDDVISFEYFMELDGNIDSFVKPLFKFKSDLIKHLKSKYGDECIGSFDETFENDSDEQEINSYQDETDETSSISTYSNLSNKNLETSTEITNNHHQTSTLSPVCDSTTLHTLDSHTPQPLDSQSSFKQEDGEPTFKRKKYYHPNNNYRNTYKRQNNNFHLENKYQDSSHHNSQDSYNRDPYRVNQYNRDQTYFPRNRNYDLNRNNNNNFKGYSGSDGRPFSDFPENKYYSQDYKNYDQHHPNFYPGGRDVYKKDNFPRNDYYFYENSQRPENPPNFNQPMRYENFANSNYLNNRIRSSSNTGRYQRY